MTANPDARSFWVRRRTWIQIAAIILFLAPLALVFQITTGDTNFCGTWCPRMFWAIRQGAGAHEIWTGIMRAFLGVALVAGILISTWFVGRAWCSHLCPVGAAGEVMAKLIPKRWQLDFSFLPVLAVRYGYLTVYLLAPLLGLGSLCCSYCNFATVPRLFGAAFNRADLLFFFRTAGLIDLALFFLLGAFARGGRAYCNTLCPIGALDSISGWLGARFGRRVRVQADQCSGCTACEKLCPTWAIKVAGVARIDQSSCLSCRQCESACPQGALSYGTLPQKS